MANLAPKSSNALPGLEVEDGSEGTSRALSPKLPHVPSRALDVGGGPGC